VTLRHRSWKWGTWMLFLNWIVSNFLTAFTHTISTTLNMGALSPIFRVVEKQIKTPTSFQGRLDCMLVHIIFKSFLIVSVLWLLTKWYKSPPFKKIIIIEVYKISLWNYTNIPYFFNYSNNLFLFFIAC